MNSMLQIDNLQVRSDVYPLLQAAGLATFEALMNFAGGTRICHKRGRSVFRLEIGGRAFFLKRNVWHAVEFWKGVSRLRLPQQEARREWRSIQQVREAGIPTVQPVAMGARNFLGLEYASFILTEELYGAEPLDRVARRDFAGNRSVDFVQRKRRIVRLLAELAGKLHAAGMNHQDFYLNHFFLDEKQVLYLLDLQRIQKRSRVPTRYRVKDLAQLNYSAQFLGCFTLTDRVRFLLAYTGKKRVDESGRRLAVHIAAKTARIARHDVKLMARRRRRGELPPAPSTSREKDQQSPIA